MTEEKWTERQLEKLRELVNNTNLTNKQIAISLNDMFNTNRTVNSIEHKMRNMLMTKPLNKNKDKDNSMDLIDNNKELVIKYLKKNIFRGFPIQTVINSTEKLHEEKSVLLLSDIHSGMVNKIFDKNSSGEITTYNSMIRQKEMLYLRDSIARIKTLLSNSFKLNHLFIYNLGDNVTNDRIFAGQVFSIDMCVGLQVIEMVKDLSFFINEMKKLYNKVTFVGMVGNHGRSTCDSNIDEPLENNYEFIMHKMIESIFKNDKNVEIIIPNSKFYIHRIYEHKYLLTHGDMVKGFTRNAIERSIKDYLIANESDFDVFCMGHIHRTDRMTLSEHNTALINGSWISKDSYGYKVAKQYSKPVQLFFGVSRKHAITWLFEINLTEV